VSYTILRDRLYLVCDNCSGRTLETKIANGDQLAATQDLWAKAARKGWTSTSTTHTCKSCQP
jgi:hypothetical protein